MTSVRQRKWFGAMTILLLVPLVFPAIGPFDRANAMSRPASKFKVSLVNGDSERWIAHSESTTRGDSSGPVVANYSPETSADPGSTPPLLYNGGPIMGTTSAGTTIHPLYWAPAGYNFQSGFESEMDTFIQDVAAGSGTNTNVFSVATQYYQYTDSSFQYFRYAITAGNELDDTDSYPASGGCQADAGLGFTACVTTAQIAAELVSYATAESFPSGFANQYTILFPPNVETCYTSSNASQGGTCSSGNADSGYCAFHTVTGSGSTSLIFSVMPYVTYCGAQVSTGQIAAIEETSVVAHEAIESMTDPVPNSGWVDGSRNEAADMCVGDFVEQTFGSTQFDVQEVFSNADYAANSNSGGCVSSLGAAIPLPITPPPAIVPLPVPKGLEVLYQGTAYAFALSATGGQGTLTWSIRSGTLPVGMSLSPSGEVTGTPTSSSGGFYKVTFVVTDERGEVSAPWTFDIALIPKLTVTSTTLPLARVGDAYQTSLSGVGGDGRITWSIQSGTLPAGMTLSASGTISGTPTTSGVFTFSVVITDFNNVVSTPKLLVLKVNSPLILRPNIEVEMAALVVNHSVIPIRLRCANAICSGSLQLTGRLSATGRMVVFGASIFSLQRNESFNVMVRLTGAGKRALAKANIRPVPTVLTVNVTGAKSFSERRLVN
jgi:hypothetical protein